MSPADFSERRTIESRRRSKERRETSRGAFGLRYPSDRRRDGGRRSFDADVEGMAYNGA